MSDTDVVTDEEHLAIWRDLRVLRQHREVRLNCWRWAAQWRQGVLVLAAMAGTVSPVQGQSELPSDLLVESQLNITSEPAGVVVEIHGQYDWVGTTPWSIYRPLVGVYRVEARRPGYQSWTREIVLGPTGVKDLHIKLSKKSRIMAAARSALLPGWGQRYNEKRGKGNLFLLAETGALIGMYVMNLRYDDKIDDYAIAEKAYLESRQIGRLPELREELETQAARADDAWDDYKVAETVAIGIYAANIIDALFFGSDETKAYTPSAGSSAAEPVETAPALGWNATWSPEGSTRLGLRVDF